MAKDTFDFLHFSNIVDILKVLKHLKITKKLKIYFDTDFLNTSNDQDLQRKLNLNNFYFLL